MSVIVTDTGFTPVPDSTNPGLADPGDGATALDLAHTDDPAALASRLGQLTLIRISFPTFSDGRAFTLARRLRMMGYTGELRALGPVIADQYAMARRVGFDAVEIPDDLAARQPEAQWKFRADWRAHDYQSRLRA
ncbi:MAG: DUF934 domain-containing protein [Gemmobacter sp.]|jgi:uncharacterized protein (DUF934 family)|nr:DUF934 domain-containing protein [Gemmobacter sp.]